MTNEELISKYYDGNMQALYDLYEQNVGFIQSVAAAVAKDYKNYLRFSDTFEDLVQVGSLTFFEKLKAKKYDARKGSLLTYLTPQLRYAMQEFIENFSSPAGLSHSDFSKIQRCRKLHNEGMSNSDISKELGMDRKTVQSCLSFFIQKTRFSTCILSDLYTLYRYTCTSTPLFLNQSYHN